MRATKSVLSFQFKCPSTGHKIETTFESDDDELILVGAHGLRMQCSFCGASHEWVFVDNEQGKDRRVRRKSRPSLSGGVAR
jgi:hypothetical protein